MLKEFIEHIQKTTQPLITNVNGSAFCVTSDGTWPRWMRAPAKSAALWTASTSTSKTPRPE